MKTFKCFLNADDENEIFNLHVLSQVETVEVCNCSESLMAEWDITINQNVKIFRLIYTKDVEFRLFDILKLGVSLGREKFEILGLHTLLDY